MSGQSRIICLTLAFCLLLTLLDIAVLNLVFFSGLVSFTMIGLYHNVFRAIGVTIPIVMALMYSSTVPILAHVFLLSGMEDTLFYVLQFHPIPEVYQGVAIAGLWEPKWWQVILLNAGGVVCLSLFLYASFYMTSFLSLHVSTRASGSG